MSSKTPRDIIIAELQALPGTLHKHEITADRIITLLRNDGFEIVCRSQLLNADGTPNNNHVEHHPV